MENNIIQEQLQAIVWLNEEKQSPGKLLIHEKQKRELLFMEERDKKEVPKWVLIKGRKGSGKKFLMRHFAHSQKQRIFFVEMAALYQCCIENGSGILGYLAYILRDAKTFLCIIMGETTEKEECFKELLYGLVMEGISGYILTDREVYMPQDGIYKQAEITLPDPDIAGRVTLWQYFLGAYVSEPDVNPQFLAARYTLNAGAIERILGSAELYSSAEDREKLAEADIVKAVKMYENNHFSTYAGYVPAVYTWEELIVSTEAGKGLRGLCDRVKYANLVGNEWGFYEKRPYGRGISALFYGPSGTGKTMAAQVIANELGLTLYRVDLSQMMSKYIGETQKNISTLFDEAKEMDAVLLFDEADAFFSKRTGVKDSHDRHSNGEVAHLLQKMEDYEGISILTTNLKENMDAAFKRRIKIMIEFQLPDAKSRSILWGKMMPEAAPLEKDVDIEFYAKQFELSGSEIQETILNAAFLAAAEGGKIRKQHIEEALRSCYMKYGRILLEEELKCL